MLIRIVADREHSEVQHGYECVHEGIVDPIDRRRGRGEIVW